MQREVDLFIIGGGVNGAGVARDAAGRGLKVMLVEQGDLAGATSSSSSKLIHGGLRYLENYEFGLVRESLLERERLWKVAPNLITPLRFVLPHHKGLRPAFILRLGLFLYDHIGGRKLLPPTKRLDLKNHAAGKPLADGFTAGFEYSDCWVDDARLVVMNALGAQELGAEILTRHTFVNGKREAGRWLISVKTEAGDIETITARMLVNAGGPWVDKALNSCNVGGKNESSVRLVKGSHIIVPKLFEHDRAYTFQNSDGRVIFAIPYEGDYTLVGTTDTPFEGDPYSAAADEQEIEYLCGAASEYFSDAIKPEGVVWHYSGVRPLYDDGAESASKATRDYVLALDQKEEQAPLLSIYGGKVTTYRRLAEEVLEKLEPFADYKRGPWTDGAALPGGDLPGREDPNNALADFILRIRASYPWLQEDLAVRYAHAYGTRTSDLISDAKSMADMGQDFGAGLTEREAAFLMATEFAKSAEDILWRRSKLGLHMTEGERSAFTNWFLAQS